MKELDGKYPPLKICPLYATLPSLQQLDAFSNPPQGTRKVILSTNIAETSVTVHKDFISNLINSLLFSSSTLISRYIRLMEYVSSLIAAESKPGKLFKLIQ